MFSIRIEPRDGLVKLALHQLNVTELERGLLPLPRPLTPPSSLTTETPRHARERRRDVSLVEGACRCCAALFRVRGFLSCQSSSCFRRFLRNLSSLAVSFDFAFGRQLPCSPCLLPLTGSYPGQQRVLFFLVGMSDSKATSIPGSVRLAHENRSVP